MTIISVDSELNDDAIRNRDLKNDLTITCPMECMIVDSSPTKSKAFNYNRRFISSHNNRQQIMMLSCCLYCRLWYVHCTCTSTSHQKELGPSEWREYTFRGSHVNIVSTDHYSFPSDINNVRKQLIPYNLGSRQIRGSN